MQRNLLLAVSTLLFVLSFYFFGSQGISLNEIITLPIKLMTSASSLSIVPVSVIYVSIFILLQVVGMLLIGIYSLKESSSNKHMLSVASGIGSILISAFFMPLNITYIFFSIGFVLSCYIASFYFPKFYEEYKVWRYFRTGSQIVKLSLIAIAISVAIGVYLDVKSNAELEESFYNSTIDALRQSISLDSDPRDIPGYENLTAEQQAQIQQEVEEQNKKIREQADSVIRTQIDRSAILKAYIGNLGLITALTILAALLFLRSIISPIGGFLSWILLLALHKKKHHGEHRTVN